MPRHEFTRDDILQNAKRILKSYAGQGLTLTLRQMWGGRDHGPHDQG